MGVGAVSSVLSSATTYAPRPVSRAATVATPARSMSTADQAPVLAAAAMTSAPLPDAALIAMQQSLAALSSGTLA